MVSVKGEISFEGQDNDTHIRAFNTFLRHFLLEVFHHKVTETPLLVHALQGESYGIKLPRGAA